MKSEYDGELEALRAMVGSLYSGLMATTKLLLQEGLQGDITKRECKLTLTRLEAAADGWHRWRTERFNREIAAAEETICKAFEIGGECKAYYGIYKKVIDEK